VGKVSLGVTTIGGFTGLRLLADFIDSIGVAGPARKDVHNPHHRDARPPPVGISYDFPWTFMSQAHLTMAWTEELQRSCSESPARCSKRSRPVPSFAPTLSDMKNHYAVWLVASGLLSSLGPCGRSAATETVGNAPATDPHLDLVAALEATSPNPSLGDQAQVLGRLVGTWDVEYTDFAKDGKAIHRTGGFIVGWVMDGRAIQDLWIVNPSGKRKDREVYTDLHYFDPKTRTWRATFVDPEHGSVARFTGGPVGNDRFVLETQDINSEQTRWSFNDIRPDSFVWRDEASSDGGKTWRLQAEYQMKRQGAAPA
jgi:hypothetical protein